MAPSFVHLRAQSAYSMLESAISPKALATAVAALGQPAVALVDRGNLFACMEFSEACLGKGVQPIVGSLLGTGRHWLPLLAQNETGYANLIALVSDAQQAGMTSGRPALDLAALTGRTDGIIALTGAADGELADLLASGQRGSAERLLGSLADLFPGRLYVELARIDEPALTAAEPHLIELADARGLPLAATNPIAFATPSQHAAHDALLCIASSAYVDSADRSRSNRNAWIKPASAMAELFADLPDAIHNTIAIAKRCAVAAPERKPILPHLDGNLRTSAEAGLAARLAGRSDASAYAERLDFEISVIERMGFSGYFLIVADFIQWAKRQGIPVGPGRGSGAGSVVAWALGITDLDPLAHGLLFERFLNPERVSMPDFDIDFCETRRGEVIRYVAERYGHDRVAQIITFGTLKARAVVKDVGRVLQMPYGQVDRLSKLIPNHPTDPWTLKRALEGVPELAVERERDAAVKRLFDIAVDLEGLPRHASTHAAGVVIGDRPLHELVPLYRDPRSDTAVTQFDMKWVERAGLVKFDFLGLKTLSVLERARQLLGAKGVDVDWLRLPLDDGPTYQLMAAGQTVGVFQLESEGMRRTLAQVKPDRFEDVVALVALYRPGPMDNIPSFANRKHGREKIALPHPALEQVLAETYGLIVYQEQVMQAAQVLAGYSLGEADLLRRAMGKKKKDEMAAQRARFVAGAAERGVSEPKAHELFDLIDKFAGYGFNKSHAAAYALLAYQTAWLKAHHPCEFFAASMQFDCHLTDKLAAFVDDAHRMGVTVLPPCVNASAPGFTVEKGAVRYALAGLKGVGEGAVEGISAAAPFRSLSDFAARVEPRLLNKRMVEALAGAGAFDAIERNRAAVHGIADALLAAAGSAAAARAVGQGSLLEASAGCDVELLVPKRAEWTLAERLEQEREAFGFYFSGHPIEQFASVLAAEGVRSFTDICASGSGGRERSRATLAALVSGCRWRSPPSGKRYVLADLSDRSGSFLGSCFDEEPQEALLRLAKEGRPALLHCELLWREGETAPRVTVRGATALADVARRARATIEVELVDPAAIDQLRALLEGRRGGRGELVARVPVATGAVRLSVRRDLVIDAEFGEALALLPGVRVEHA